MNRFFTIDIETVGNDIGSVCQIGAALFEGGKLKDTFQTNCVPEIDPNDFNGYAMEVHGINVESFSKGISGRKAVSELLMWAGDEAVFFHWAGSEPKQLNHLSDQPLNLVNGHPLVKRNAPEMGEPEGKESKVKFTMERLGKRIDPKFNAHDALEDAVMTGRVLLKAAELVGWEKLTTKIDVQTNDNSASYIAKQKAMLGGSVDGAKILFTAVDSVTKKLLTDLAKKAGYNVVSGVSKSLKVVVCGSAQTTTKPEKAKALNPEILILDDRQFHLMMQEMGIAK